MARAFGAIMIVVAGVYAATAFVVWDLAWPLDLAKGPDGGWRGVDRAMLVWTLAVVAFFAAVARFGARRP